MRSKLSVKEQIARLRNSGGRDIEAEEKIWEELSAKFQSVLTVEETTTPTLMK